MQCASFKLGVWFVCWASGVLGVRIGCFLLSFFRLVIAATWTNETWNTYLMMPAICISLRMTACGLTASMHTWNILLLFCRQKMHACRHACIYDCMRYYRKKVHLLQLHIAVHDRTTCVFFACCNDPTALHTNGLLRACCCPNALKARKGLACIRPCMYKAFNVMSYNLAF